MQPVTYLYLLLYRKIIQYYCKQYESAKQVTFLIDTSKTFSCLPRSRFFQFLFLFFHEYFLIYNMLDRNTSETV